MIAHDALLALLRYDPETGRFIRLVKRGSERVGTVAGTVNKNGYCQVQVEGRLHRAHRLAWFYMTGEWPEADVDHVNGDRLDNRWKNLREATRSQNNANRRATIDKGLKGTSYNIRRGRWMAKINVNHQQIYLGYFDTAEEAHAAYVAAARLHYGEFARAA